MVIGACLLAVVALNGLVLWLASRRPVARERAIRESGNVVVLRVTAAPLTYCPGKPNRERVPRVPALIVDMGQARLLPRVDLEV